MGGLGERREGDKDSWFAKFVGFSYIFVGANLVVVMCIRV